MFKTSYFYRSLSFRNTATLREGLTKLTLSRKNKKLPHFSRIHLLLLTECIRIYIRFAYDSFFFCKFHQTGKYCIASLHLKSKTAVKIEVAN